MKKCKKLVDLKKTPGNLPQVKKKKKKKKEKRKNEKRKNEKKRVRRLVYKMAIRFFEKKRKPK